MKTWKKVLLASLLVPVVIVVLWVSYLGEHSMRTAKPYEVNTPSAKEHVLIATQGSAFKDAVVDGVVDKLKARQAYVKVIDVSQLPSVRDSDWNAIVLLHTWEMSKPPESVRAFVDRAESRDKLVVLTTSGGGKEHMAGVDAITSASSKSDVPARVDEIVQRLDKVLTVHAPQI